jgi:hypothetical protein
LALVNEPLTTSDVQLSREKISLLMTKARTQGAHRAMFSGSLPASSRGLSVAPWKRPAIPSRAVIMALARNGL